MIIEGNDYSADSNSSEFDVVVVGAGIVGLYMAARLLKDNPKRNICIVESGAITPEMESNKKNAVSIGQVHNGTLNGRYSGLGGGSFKWGGQLAEFEESDFERPDFKWPMGYGEVNAHYKEVYSFLGIKNSFSDTFFNKIYNNKDKESSKIESYYTVRLKDRNTEFSTYFEKEIHGKALTIVVNTTAYKINFKEKHANALLCKTKEGKYISIKGDRFIFASGTLGINQFFLSTQALYEVPWKHNTFIGKYFQDHLGGVVAKLKVRNEKMFRNAFEKKMVNGIKIERKLKFRKSYRKKMLNGVVVFFKYETKQYERIDRFRSFIRQLKNDRKLNNSRAFVKDFYRIRGYVFSFFTKLVFKRQLHEAFDKNGILVFAQSEQVPTAQSQITISKDKMLENGLFKICVNWAWVGKEIEAIQSIVFELKEYLKEQNIGDVEIYPEIKEGNPSVLTTFRDTNHQCGGMMMSSSEKDGVVDSDCKVWGTDNVWVAGAAVFPSSGHANSTLTALAIAERTIQNSFTPK